MSRQYLLSHCRLATHDLDEARARVGRLWERHNSELIGGRTYAVRWHQAPLQHASLSFIANSSRLRVDGTVGTKYHLTFCESGGAVHRIRGQETVASPDTMIIHRPGEDLQLDLEPFEALLLSFDADYAENLLRRRNPRAFAGGEWPSVLPVHLPAVATLRSLCRWAAMELDQEGSQLLVSPAAQAGLERMLATLFVDALTADLPSVERNVAQVGEAQLARVDAWLDANFARQIGVEDLARVAGVSVRALQATFRRTRGHTPQQAIQKRRLAAARELLLTGGAAVTVTQAAFDCGLLHLGRFAAAYAAAYGETPSRTLTARRIRRNQPPAAAGRPRLAIDGMEPGLDSVSDCEPPADVQVATDLAAPHML
jgi:AraC-like DNA-binding protein